MAADEHKLSSFEVALKRGAIVSEVMELEWRGEVHRFRFREISQDRIDRFRRESIQWVEDDRRRRESTGGEWRDAQGDLDAMRANELDLRMLAYSMVCEDDEKRPLAPLQALRDGLPPDVQEHLANGYKAFRESISPDTMSEEAVAALAEGLKKNEVDVGWLVTRFGFRTLIACERYLVNQLAAYEIERLTPTSSGEARPSPPDSKTPPSDPT